MSQENVETVRAAIEAANRGDLDAAFKDAAPSFEWDNTRAMNADTQGILTVSQAREAFKEALGLFGSVWIEINELIPIGDQVVVPHTFHVRGRDGIEVQARSTWVFTMRNGTLERVCLYQEKEDALEALGLSE